ncbi:PF09594 family protein [Burkholderia aenigmatica]|uniref:glycosyltransferase family 87 protein n=1 Tax=Burkholderia cepacia complex TaxID=87882 RepID=UPI001453ACDA|nr:MULTISPECIES: glycosyltransferase family 87 protein [Burkholderia cepacia complex]VWC58026.1 PF09594 family protein [Burkholderia aenigmatica]
MAGWAMGTVHRSGGRAADARRLGTYAAVVLALQIVILAVWAFRYYGLHDRASPMVGSDFAVFWTAARVAIEHGAAAIFSPRVMQPIEAALRPLADFTPWPYPPTFLLVIIPFGLVPFVAALVMFGVLQIACYTAVLARLVRPLDGQLRIAIAAFPGLIGAALPMQNAFLTVAAAAAALMLLESSPVVAGACIAVLVVKPQFGILFPLALVCGRHWKALISAGVFSAGIVAVSVAAFGVRAWAAFFAFMPEFHRNVVEYGDTFRRGMPSTMSLARAAGLPVGSAYVVHVVVAILAAAAVACVWMRRARFELRAAAVAAGTLLVQPYYMYYDLLWLVLPIAYLMLDARHVRLRRSEVVVVVLAWVAPAQAFIATITGTGWPVASVILIAVLAMIVRRSGAPARLAA